MMVEKDIKVVYISAQCLATDYISSNLGQFVPVLKRMKYLRDLDFEGFYYDEPPPIHLFVDLPIIRLTPSEFKFEKENLKEIVHTMSQIRSLKYVRIESNDFRVYYKLSPNDLLLFQRLPVTYVDPSILDLSEATAPVFRGVMNQMKSVSFNSSRYLMRCLDEYDSP